MKKNPIAMADTMNAMLPLIERLMLHLLALGQYFVPAAVGVGGCCFGERIGFSMLKEVVVVEKVGAVVGAVVGAALGGGACLDVWWGGSLASLVDAAAWLSVEEDGVVVGMV